MAREMLVGTGCPPQVSHLPNCFFIVTQSHTLCAALKYFLPPFIQQQLEKEHGVREPGWGGANLKT